MILGHNIPYEINLNKIGIEFKDIVNEIVNEVLSNLENLDKESLIKMNITHTNYAVEYRIKFRRTNNSVCKYYFFRIDKTNSFIFSNLDFIKILPSEKKKYMDFEYEEPESYDKLQELIQTLYYVKDVCK
jgi:hypothetical protein